MLTNTELVELIKTIREGHCRSYVDAARVLAEEFLPVIRTRLEDPSNLVVEYQHMFVNLTNSQAQCTELIQKNREQASLIAAYRDTALTQSFKRAMEEEGE